MYKLSEHQIDFILRDIRRRGVQSESLQQSLLDHVSCIIEQELDKNENFEEFYYLTISDFYNGQLHEIERETKLLLTYKNLNLMKKVMLVSGIFSAIAILIGIHFKLMLYPRADIFLSTGILTGSLVFMPLLFILKVGTEKDLTGKLIIASASFSGLLLSISVLFKIMHWPYAPNILFISAVIMGLVFLPLFAKREFKKPESRTNALSFSVLILFFYGLLISVMSTPGTYYPNKTLYTHDYLRNEKILNRELTFFNLKHSNAKPSSLTTQKLMKSCEDFKLVILQQENANRVVDIKAGSEEILVEDHKIYVTPAIMNNFKLMKELIQEYNISLPNPDKRFPTKGSFLDTEYPNARASLVLSEIVQVQMFILQNEREFVAAK